MLNQLSEEILRVLLDVGDNGVQVTILNPNNTSRFFISKIGEALKEEITEHYVKNHIQCMFYYQGGKVTKKNFVECKGVDVMDKIEPYINEGAKGIRIEIDGKIWVLVKAI